MAENSRVGFFRWRVPGDSLLLSDLRLLCLLRGGLREVLRPLRLLLSEEEEEEEEEERDEEAVRKVRFAE